MKVLSSKSDDSFSQSLLKIHIRLIYGMNQANHGGYVKLLWYDKKRF